MGPGYLGLMLADTPQEIVRIRGAKVPRGALVADVIRDGPARFVQPGDVLIAVNGKAIADPAGARAAVRALPAGKSAVLNVWRQGQLLTMSYVLGAAPVYRLIPPPAALDTCPAPVVQPPLTLGPGEACLYISGTVLSGVPPHPVSGAIVSLVTRSGAVPVAVSQTLVNGAFVVGLLRPGSYVVEAAAAGETARRVLDVPRAGLQEIDLVLSAPPPLVLRTTVYTGFVPAEEATTLTLVPRGYLGLVLRDAAPPAEDLPKRGPGAGVVVEEVTPGGPGAAAGILPGDVVTALAGLPMVSPAQMLNTVRRLPKGKKVTVSIIRKGQRIEVPAVVGEVRLTPVVQPEPPPAVVVQPEPLPLALDGLGPRVPQAPQLARPLQPQPQVLEDTEIELL